MIVIYDIIQSFSMYNITQKSSFPHFANKFSGIYQPPLNFHFSQFSHSRFPSLQTSGCCARAMAASASAAAAPSQQSMAPFGSFGFNTTGAVRLESRTGLNFFNEHEHPG